MPFHTKTRGLKHGIVHGVKRGSIFASMTGVSRDATSLVYRPASGTEWATTLATAGINPALLPTLVFGCQDLSADLVDAMGTGVVLTAAGTVGYQAAVSGWSSKAVTVAEIAGSRFMAAAASGPNPASTSVLWLWYIDITASGGNRAIISAGGAATATELSLRNVVTTHALTVKDQAAAVNGSSDIMAGGVRPLALRYNRTAATVTGFSDLEKVVGTYGAGVTDGLKGIGDNVAGITPVALSAVYGVCFAGTAAEMSDAQLKSLETVLGFSPLWT